MNIFRSFTGRAYVLAAVLPLLAGLLSACDVDSADSTTAVVSDTDGTIYNFAGLYLPTGTNTEFLVYPFNRQSGVKLTWIRLLQYGNVLEAYDNAGKSWDGSISSITDGNASFNLRGQTTAGAAVEIAGALHYTNQNSTMDAAWIEPGFSGSIFAQAAVASPAINAPESKVTLNGTSTTISLDDTVKLNASGGTSYRWSVTPTTYGSLAHTGNYSTNAYTRTSGTADNSATITVTSGSESDSWDLDFN
ncbi:MAG: hypothetical protein GX634_04915 [Lentisphaerae bacterium]|nr:hypothetical protein [Lentisphaerota bacterium]